ncbi:MAG: hypothetical protein CVU59_13770, partial [Deltaproteobacteria bacterium HGW-Deltaproteobacteria-17]
STQRGATQARLEAQLARPRAERGGEPQMPVATPRQETRKTSPAHGLWAARKWSRAERAEMADFLGTLARKPKPRSGRELAQQALAAAGKAGEAYEQENGDRGASLRSSPTKGKPIERISLDLYFDAFINKMNQSARSVKRPETSAGYGKALVEIAIGVDGSVTAFHVLRAANQQAEIEYVRAVVAMQKQDAAAAGEISHAEPADRAWDREAVASVLREVDGNLSRAARRLGIARSTLRHRVDQLGLDALIPRD